MRPELLIPALEVIAPLLRAADERHLPPGEREAGEREAGEREHGQRERGEGERGGGERGESTGGGRVVVGITGPPGAGKSSLAEAIVEAADVSAVWVPMDGFHLSNVELVRLGLANRKGAPETFDAAGFVHLLGRIVAREELVYAPSYSRVLHESIGGVIPVFGSTRLVVVEGNYLLMQSQPWLRLRSMLDLVFYVDIPDEVRVPGLIRRQRSFGLDAEQARDWVERSDEANARLVAATRPYADVVLTRG